ncbi:MAG: hypothetical protein NTV43_17895 [Methylococcales bacterium]|nr:hypothetical protein [Methylococcales bacterium]
MKKIFKQSGLIAATSLLLIPAAHAANFTVSGADTAAKTLNAGQTGTVPTQGC